MSVLNRSLINRVSKLEPKKMPDGVRVILLCPLTADDGRPADPQPEVTGARNTTTGEWVARAPSEPLEQFEHRFGEWAREHYPNVSMWVLTSAEDSPEESAR